MVCKVRTLGAKDIYQKMPDKDLEKEHTAQEDSLPREQNRGII